MENYSFSAKRVINKIRHEKLRRIVTNKSWEVGISDIKRKNELIVSLTSYPKRFDDIDMCLKSISLQSIKPNRIIVWLGNDTSDYEFKKIKEKYINFGIDFIRDSNNNFFSHKKYYYAMQDFPEAIVVTADDDLIYPSDWLESMLEEHNKNTDYICSRRVHRILWDEYGNPLPYKKWQGEVRYKSPSKSLIATTGAGALFPPGCLARETFNYTNFMKYAKTADDIWIKVMSILSDLKIKWVDSKMIMPTTIDLQQKDMLSRVNVDNNLNDVIFDSLLNLYKLTAKDFCDY